MSKTEKPAATETIEAPPKKSKKMLFIIIALVVVLIGGGVVAFLLLTPAHPAKPEEAAAAEHGKETATYVELGTFTANLIREEGDRYLQVGISLKLTKADLEEKVKASKPEIMHRVNMLLQSKRPSELSTIQGKEILAQEIKEQIEYVMGFRKVAPVIGGTQAESIQGESAPARTAPLKIRSDLAEVLFTSFIIQ